MNQTRFIEILTIPDGYNGHKVTVGIVYDYQLGQIVLAHAHGWHPITQRQLDFYRNH